MINYFVHDVTAGSDAKIVGLLMKHGCLGYGVYWRIIEQMACTTDGMLATDYNKLGWLIREKADIVKSVICDFELFKFSEDKKFFFSERLKKSLEAINEKSLKAKEKAEKRWKKQSQSNTVAEPKQSISNAVAMQQQCSSNATAMQIKQDKIKEDNTISPLNPPKAEKENMENFEAFWRAYPRKEGKQVALKAFAKVKVSIDVLLGAIEKQKKCDQWQKDNGQFIPHASTWLNQCRWEDECIQSSQPKSVYQPKQTMTQQQEFDVYRHFLEGGNNGK